MYGKDAFLFSFLKALGVHFYDDEFLALVFEFLTYYLPYPAVPADYAVVFLFLVLASALLCLRVDSEKSPKKYSRTAPKV